MTRYWGKLLVSATGLLLTLGGVSNAVLDELGAQIQWVHSYVTDDKIYCVYIAPSEELIQAHAEQSGFPANRVSEVRAIIDPTTGN